MPTSTIRRFQRSDRGDLARLVNAHVAVLLPGAQLSTQRILAQVEDEPEEVISNPWVDSRVCLVGLEGPRLVGAALLVHYSSDESTSPSLRGIGSLRWLIGDIGAEGALDDLLDASSRWARTQGSTELLHEGVLPVPGCFGAPEQWPHVTSALDRAQFTPGMDRLMTLTKSPDSSGDLSDVQRSVGLCGTRFSLEDRRGTAGFIEIETADADRSAFPGGGRCMEIGNLWARPGSEPAVPQRLLAAAERWCTLSGASLLVGYASSDDEDMQWMTANGFEVLGGCVRGRKKILVR